MSGKAIAWYVLSNNADILAQVPATNIYVGIPPMDFPLPAISVSTITAASRNFVSMDSATYLWTERVQVTVSTGTGTLKQLLIKLVATAMKSARGNVNGFDCDSILSAGIGPDMDDPATTIFEQSSDFIIRFNQ